MPGTSRSPPMGDSSRCAPTDLASWRWQRGLFAAALPFAALLQGIEVFHAGAVVVEGRLAAVTAQSGGGKSTLAAFLRLAGACFFTDDVLALERCENDVVAHPGPPLLNLRHSTAELLTPEERPVLGSILGTDPTEARVRTEPFETPLPVSALYFLDRRNDVAAVSFEPVTEPSRWLLASSYNFVIRTPDRLLGQLDLCSRSGRHRAADARRRACGYKPAEPRRGRARARRERLNERDARVTPSPGMGRSPRACGRGSRIARRACAGQTGRPGGSATVRP